MQLEKEIVKEKNKEHIGKIYEVLIESKRPDGKYYIGRTYMDIPETDGVVLINVGAGHRARPDYNEGDFINCRITELNEYDLIGEIVD